MDSNDCDSANGYVNMGKLCHKIQPQLQLKKKPDAEKLCSGREMIFVPKDREDNINFRQFAKEVELKSQKVRNLQPFSVCPLRIIPTLISGSG